MSENPPMANADHGNELRIQRVSSSRIRQVDFDRLGFGNVFSDHMFSMRYVDGAWQTPEVIPCAPISVEPACLALHYGQTVFEGLKAFRGVDGQIRLFRPDRNEARLESSCLRLCIPPLPRGTLEMAIRRLIWLDHEWIPHRRGQSLYLRPLIFAEESHLGVRPASRYRFLLMTAPVDNYHPGGMEAIGLKVKERFARAAPGGVGGAKTAGNYAASLLPARESHDEGFDQVLWLDAATQAHVEEVGHMNIFFHLAGKVLTPALTGTILPGVTRDSVLTLLREHGYQAEERSIAIREVLEGVRYGTLAEAFGTGTATVVAPVGRIGYREHTYEINRNRPGPLAEWLYGQLLGIQLGELADRHGWTVNLGLPAFVQP
jgi:branched-chain amino acid aminotransferase